MYYLSFIFCTYCSVGWSETYFRFLCMSGTYCRIDNKVDLNWAASPSDAAPTDKVWEAGCPVVLKLKTPGRPQTLSFSRLAARFLAFKYTSETYNPRRSESPRVSQGRSLRHHICEPLMTLGVIKLKFCRLWDAFTPFWWLWGEDQHIRAGQHVVPVCLVKLHDLVV